jgi:streptogramin lyase
MMTGSSGLRVRISSKVTGALINYDHSSTLWTYSQKTSAAARNAWMSRQRCAWLTTVSAASTENNHPCCIFFPKQLLDR